MESLLDDLRLAARDLRRHAGLSLLVVLTLAIATACTTAMFSVVRGVLLKPLPWPDAGRLAMIWNVPPQRADELELSQAEVGDLEELLPGVAVGSYSTETTAVRIGERTETWLATWVTRQAFEMLGARPVLGRPFAAEDYDPAGPATVILSHELWQGALGGDPRVLGRRLEIEGVAHQVVGVMPADLPLPLEYRQRQPTQLWIGSRLGWAARWSRQTRMFPGLARLREGVTLEAARQQLDAAVEELRRRHPEDYPAGWRMRLVPVAEELLGEIRPALWALFGAVFFVLMIACANVAHLLLAHHDARRHEIAVKSALGAGRGRLVRQLLVESLVLALAGGGAGTLGAYGAVALLLALQPGNLPRIDHVAIDPVVLAFALAASLATALLFGLLPALDLASTRPQGVLHRGRGAVGGLRPRGARRLLLIGEVALASVLLAGAGLLVETLRNLARADLGFEPAGLLAVGVSLPRDAYPETADRLRVWDRIRHDAAQLPGVASASITTMVPFYSGVMSRAMEVEGGGSAPLEVPRVSIDRAGPGIAGTMGMPLLAGRDLGEDDRPESEPVALVNETLARHLVAGGGPAAAVAAVGRRLRFPDRPWITVVGVLADEVHDSFDAAPRPRIVLPYRQLPVAGGWPISPFQWLALRGAAATTPSIEAARAALAAVDPEIVVSPVLPMAEHVATAAFARYRFAAFVLGLFAAVALALAVVGIYGLLSYVVRRGRREVGVRLALGARRADLYRQVTRQGLLLGVAGLALGTPAALALTGLLRSVLYGVQPTDPTTFLATGGLLLTVAGAASVVPARRAMEVQPVEVLRSE